MGCGGSLSSEKFSFKIHYFGLRLCDVLNDMLKHEKREIIIVSKA